MRAAIFLLAALVFAAFLVLDTAALLRLAAACFTGAFGYVPAVVLAGVTALALFALVSRSAPRPRRKVPAARSPKRPPAATKAAPKQAAGRKQAEGAKRAAGPKQVAGAKHEAGRKPASGRKVSAKAPQNR